MYRSLCVVFPEVGLHSETFIRWDVHNLLPGGTVALVDPPPGGQSVQGEVAWRCDVPALIFPPVVGDPPPSPQRRDAAAAFLTAHGVEVALVEYLDFASRWLDLLRDLGLRVWLRGHGVDLSARLRDPHWRTTYRRYDDVEGILLPSQVAADRLVRLGLSAERLHVVPYGVDVGPRAVNAHKNQGVIRCVAVGRVVPKKGPLLLLDAFRRARERLSQLHLDLVGDGPLLPAVREFVTEHGLSAAVRFHGALPHHEVLAILARSDVLVHHAVTAPDGDAEGLPVAVLEAMAAGLAVITTRHEGIPEAVTHGVNGILVPERDTSAMAEALVGLALQPRVRERLGRNAWHTAHTHYSRITHGERLRELLGLPQVRTGEAPA